MKTGEQIKCGDGEIGTVKIIGDFLPEYSAFPLRDVVVAEVAAIRRSAPTEDDPFMMFDERESEADEQAFLGLSKFS
jgi:hypothetical protein